jgi:glycosyltransferase involved in cell wall biosynthesis
MKSKTKTKRLLLVSYRLSTTGGIETYNRSVAAAFSGAGWDVVALNPTDAINKEVDGVQWVGLCSNNPILKRLHLRRSLKRASVWLERHIDSFDLVLCGHANFAPVVYPLAKQRNLPYAVVLHGLEVWRSLSGEQIESLRQADALVPVSSFTQEEVIRRFGLEDSHFVKISPSVDVQAFTPDPEVRDAARPFRLMTVGRMAGPDRDKGHRVALGAIHALKARGNFDVFYEIVGDGPDQPALMQLAQELNILPQVRFSGRVSEAEKLEAYRKCDVFVMVAPLQKLEAGALSGEGFGIVFLEASACGKPVIAAEDGGGSVDPVQERITGFRCKSTPEELATCIEMLRDDLEAGIDYGKSAREFVCNNYSSEVIRQKWLNLAEELTRG